MGIRMNGFFARLCWKRFRIAKQRNKRQHPEKRYAMLSRVFNVTMENDSTSFSVGSY
jgi:hypothetical protein